MRSRRVLVLRLGVWGSGVDAKSVRSVRKRPQAFAVCSQASVAENRRKTQNCLSSLLDLRCVFASEKCQQSRASGGVLVAKRRSVVTVGLAFGLRVSKVSTVKGSRGSWSRNAELSSLLDSRCVFASQQCQQSWSRNAEMSSLLDPYLVLASQDCQQSQG